MLNRDQKARLQVLSVFVAAVWVVLGVANGWPVWVWIVLAVVSLVAPSLIALALTERAFRGSRPPQPEGVTVEAPPPQPEPPQPQQYSVKDVLLRSAEADYQFVFSCTVFWLPRADAPGLPHANPGALAADAILEEATALAATMQPDDAGRARYQLTSALGTQRVDRTGRVQAWADHVSLDLSEKDKQRLARLAEVRKDEEVFEHQCDYERKVRAYLGEDVLTSLGSAIVWWLAGTESEEKKRVDEAVAKIDNLRSLIRAAAVTDNETDVEGASRFTGFDHEGFAYRAQHGDGGLPQLPFVVAQPPVVDGGTAPEREPGMEDHVRGMVNQMPDGAERAFFARRLADLLEAHGYTDIGHDVRDRFDTPSSPPEPDGTSPDGTAATLPDDGSLDHGDAGSKPEEDASRENETTGELPPVSRNDEGAVDEPGETESRL